MKKKKESKTQSKSGAFINSEKDIIEPGDYK